MYPRNAASPERISIGPVIQISDGAVQTSGVTVRVLPFGGSEADGGGTTAYSTDGVVVYTPTQAETNYTSFVLIAKKTGCIPASVTVVTSASNVAGHAGTDHSKIQNATATVNFSGTSIKTATDVETDTQDIQSRIPAALVDGRIAANAQVVGDKTGYTATVSDKTGFSLLAGTGLGNQTANITGNLTGSVGSVTGSVGSVTSPVSVSDKTGFKLASDGLALVTAWTVGITGNLTGNVTGSVGSISGVTFPANFGSLDITVGGAIAELGTGALTANGAGDAIETYVWGALLANHTAANSFGARIIRSANSNNTVQISGGGSNHIFAVLHDAEPNSIPEDAFVSGAVSARVIATDAIDADAMAASANTEIANAVAGIQALSRLDSMIESDGTGQFRFDTIALENAPAGGGGGGTDWTANERTAIRSILGIPASGTTPTDPTSGILDEIRDSVGAIGINVYPVSASTPERVQGTTLTFYRNESRAVSVVTDFTLTNLTLQFTVEDQDGNDVYALANGSISRSGQTFTVAVTTAVTGNLGQYRWSMRDISGGGSSVVAMGVLTVQEAASNV
jgi:hypothetical protein